MASNTPLLPGKTRASFRPVFMLPRWFVLPKRLLDRILKALVGDMTFRKGAILAVLAFVYLFVSMQYLAPLVRRFFIIAFHLRLEESLFWTGMVLYGIPVVFAFILWIHYSGLWYLVVEALCLFVAIFFAIGFWGLLFHFPMVKDMGFLRAYSKWVDHSMGFLWSIFAMVVIAFLMFRSRARFFFNVLPRPEIVQMPSVDPIPRRQGRVR